MKLPGRVRSIVDEMEGLKDSDKAKLLRHLSDMEDSLPEHPTPAEAMRIVKGALKKLEISVGKSEDKEEKKEEKKEVKEAKLSFKAFLIAETQSTAYKDQIMDAAEALGIEQDYLEAIDTELKDRVAYTSTSLRRALRNIGIDHYVDDICDRIGLA